MEVHLRPVHADVGNGPPWCNDIFAKSERSRDADRLDCSINASPSSQPHDRFGRFAVTTAHSCCSAEALRYRETIVVDIDHYDVRRRKALCRKESCESDRSAPTISTVAPGCIFAVEHATLKA